MKWHYQFTPNDGYDYDSVQVPVLADMNWRGRPAKVMLWANRNGYFYVLDRESGRFLSGTPFVKVNWASGFDEGGRPMQTPQPAGSPTWPGNQGGTNWYSPSYSPRTELFYVSAWENYASIYRKEAVEFVPGRNFVGGGFRVLAPSPDAPTPGIGRRSPINNWTNVVANGAVIAIDPRRASTSGSSRSTTSPTAGSSRRQAISCLQGAAKAISTPSTRGRDRCCGRSTSADRSSTDR